MKAGIDLPGKDNNLNLLRFVAALLVIFSHAFVLTARGADPISTMTGGQTTGGQLAVLLFFFYGGLLIMKSMESKKNAREFFKARALRLFPSLWIVVICSTLILGPLLTTLPVSEYLKSVGTWKYLINGLLIPVHSLPGVFEGNPAVSTVNGSLWTLPVEFLCYVLCYVFYRLGLSKGKRPLLFLPFVAAAAAAAWLLLKNHEVLRNAILPVLFFYIGMVCYLFCKWIPINGYVALGAVILLIVSVIGRFFLPAVCVLYPYILLFLGFGTRKKLPGFGRRLELSYGVYLCGFPIQQTLIHFIPQMSPWVNFVLASCASICISIPITMLDKRISMRLRR